MRKITVIGISILSVFILCSLSYQPMVADIHIEEIKETETSTSKIDLIRTVYSNILETKQNEDCDCQSNSNNDYPIICAILIIIMIILIPLDLFTLILNELGSFTPFYIIDIIGLILSLILGIPTLIFATVGSILECWENKFYPTMIYSLNPDVMLK